LSFSSEAFLEVSQTFFAFLYADLSIIIRRLQLADLDLVAFLLFAQEVDLPLAGLQLDFKPFSLLSLVIQKLVLSA
jgi:hypothetical protein